MKEVLCHQRLGPMMRLGSLLWMYSPNYKTCALDNLKSVLNHESFHEAYGIIPKVVTQLKELLQAVRPLMLLCRLSILQHMKWRRIGRLPLSKPLQNYLRVSDISSTHVVHELL